MHINKATQAFIDNPKLMDTGFYSTPKLMRRFQMSREEIEQSKSQAKSLLSAKAFRDSATTYSSIQVTAPAITFQQETGIQEKKEDIISGETTIKFHHSDECLSEEQIWEETKMDKNKWNFVQIYHKKFGRGFLYTANFRAKQTNTQEFFQESFTEFLKGYTPKAAPKKVTINMDALLDNVSVIIPKQDAHFDKYDIHGDNDIHDRIDVLHESVLEILADIAETQNIKEIVYVVGSDQFNSEWTSLTTKGTPQTNLCSYEDGFKIICNAEVAMIDYMLEFSPNIKVVYIPGNHDRYVGWHLVSWLQCYYRETVGVNFDLGIENTKYHRYNNTGIMLNHGDAQKPKDLASKFPQGFKSEWSKCDNYMIICGDKHHEKALDIDGIQYYQVPQLSASTSFWDDKRGYTHSKVEMNIFTIGSKKGLKRIYKDSLK